MKTLLSFALIFSLNYSFTANAESLQGMKIELNFDKSYDSSEVDSQYLKFVPENYRFPSSTSLGKRQKAKFEEALDIMEEIVNSEDFKQKVLSYERVIGKDSSGNDIKSRSYANNYIWNDKENPLSNEDIYNILMKGDEKSRENTLGEMNFNSYVRVCKWYQRKFTWCKGVIGSTAPRTSKWIKLNWKFYKKFETEEMVSNMIHEWIHLLGFLHGPRSTMRQEAPYIIGGIAKEVAKNILENRQASK
jgi:hypothetical protein